MEVQNDLKSRSSRGYVPVLNRRSCSHVPRKCLNTYKGSPGVFHKRKIQSKTTWSENYVVFLVSQCFTRNDGKCRSFGDLHIMD